MKSFRAQKQVGKLLKELQSHTTAKTAGKKISEEWWLRDVADDGPHLVEMPCEGPGPVW